MLIDRKVIRWKISIFTGWVWMIKDIFLRLMIREKR